MPTLPPLLALAILASMPPAAVANPPDADAGLRSAVSDRLDAMASEIAAREASRDRAPLLARKFTVDTFLGVGTVLASLQRGGVPDPFPLWRFDFLDAPRPLAAESGAATEPGSGRAWLAAFESILLEAVAGDDPVAIAGSVLADENGIAILANWCEPCMAPLAVDFPILPEAFLLEWSDAFRRVVASHPIVASHLEAAADAPPPLDQPEDLYDLFDGLRPLPFLQASSPTDPAVPSAHAAAGEAASHGETGECLQRVSWRTEPLDPSMPAAADRLQIEVLQPPISIRWRSGETYRLRGERRGETFREEILRPEGRLRQHPEGLTASIVAARREGMPTRIDALVRRGEAVAATIRWSEVRAISTVEAETIRRSWREVASDGNAWRSLDDRWAAAHPEGSAMQAGRRAVIASLRSGDPEAFAVAAASWRRSMRSRGLPEDLELRAWEQLAEWLASEGEDARVEQVVSGPWRVAIDALPTDLRCGLAESRLRQGRFAAAILLAMPSADPLPHGSMPHRLPWWWPEIVERSQGDGSRRPQMPWIEPPGRPCLDRLVSEGEAAALARSAAFHGPPLNAAADARGDVTPRDPPSDPPSREVPPPAAAATPSPRPATLPPEPAP